MWASGGGTLTLMFQIQLNHRGDVGKDTYSTIMFISWSIMVTTLTHQWTNEYSRRQVIMIYGICVLMQTTYYSGVIGYITAMSDR